MQIGLGCLLSDRMDDENGQQILYSSPKATHKKWENIFWQLQNVPHAFIYTTNIHPMLENN